MWHSLRVWAGRAEPAPAGLSAGCSVLWFYASSYMEQPGPNVGNPAVIVKAHPFSAEPLGYRWSWASEFIFKIRIPIHFIWLRKFCNARVHFLISLGSTETEITIIHEIKKALQFNVWTWLFPFRWEDFGRLWSARAARGQCPQCWAVLILRNPTEQDHGKEQQ